MAYMSQTEQQLKLHEFFDKLKERAFKHIADGGELMESSNPGADVLSLTFWKNPEPKRYTFAEAYVMMKAGKWMRPIGNETHYRWHESCERWQIRNRVINENKTTISFTIEIALIGQEWEEVQP